MLIPGRRLTCTAAGERTGSEFAGCCLTADRFNPDYRVECPSTESFVYKELNLA